MMTTEERKNCNRCKVKLLLTEFKQKRDGTLLKQCIRCNIKKGERNKRNKCPHGRIKYDCTEGDCNGSNICIHGRRKDLCKEGECNGSQICIHGRQKATCNEDECNGSNICPHGRQKSQCNEDECNGSQICPHGRLKYQCNKDECNGSQICFHDIQKSSCKICSDPIKVTIQKWLSSTKVCDKNRNHFDIVNIIDKQFCKNLVEEYPECYYCKITLQYVTYQDDLSTIERLDNKLGHIKSNCVLACRKCNLSKIGDILNKLNESLV